MLVRVKQQKYLELFKGLDSAHQVVQLEIKILELEVKWLYNQHQDLEQEPQEVDQEWPCNQHQDLEQELQEVDQVQEWLYNQHQDLELVLH